MTNPLAHSLPVIAAIVASLVPPAAGAGGPRVAAGATAGVLGGGVELAIAASDDVVIRSSLTALPLSFDESTDDLDYSVDADLAWLGGFVDWHPGAGPFRLTAGVLFDVGSIDAVGVARDDLDLPFDLEPGDLGRVVGDASPDGPIPYAGVGWGRAFGGDRRWVVLVDAGAAWPGDVEVDLRVEGPLAILNVLGPVEEEEADLERELNDELGRWDPVPVVQVLRRF